MQTRPDSSDTSVTGCSNFFVGQPGGFAEQKGVSIFWRELIESFLNNDRELLTRRNGRVLQFNGNGPSVRVAAVVQGEIAGNPKHPDALTFRRFLRHGMTCNAQKDLLREVRCVICPDNPAQIPKYSVPMRREEQVGVCHRGVSLTINPTRAEKFQKVRTLRSCGWAQNRGPSIPTGQITEPQFRNFSHETTLLSGDDIGIRVTGSVDANGRIQGTLVAKIDGKWVDVVNAPSAGR